MFKIAAANVSPATELLLMTYNTFLYQLYRITCIETIHAKNRLLLHTGSVNLLNWKVLEGSEQVMF